MADKLKLNQVTGGNNLATLNGNFDKIAEVVNENLLSRAVEQYDQPNQMETDLDMNGNHIYNLPFPTTRMEPLTREAIDTTLAILDKNMDHYHEANQIMEYTINSAAATLQNKLDAEDAARRAEEAAGIAGGGGVVVRSFNGRDGAVTPMVGDYSKAMVGLSSVDNTSDDAKPISTAQALKNNNFQSQIDTIIAGGGGGGNPGVTSFNGRQGIVTARSGDYDKAMIGLPNVDNTSDAAKPISDAQAAKNAEIIAMIGSSTNTAVQLGKNNLLINGDFDVQQRPNIVTLVNQTGWCGDRWSFSNAANGSRTACGAYFNQHSGNYGRVQVEVGAGHSSGNSNISQYLDSGDVAKFQLRGTFFSFDVMISGKAGASIFASTVRCNTADGGYKLMCFKHTYDGSGNWKRYSIYIPPLGSGVELAAISNTPVMTFAIVLGAAPGLAGAYFEDSAMPQAWPASNHSYTFAGQTDLMATTGMAFHIRRATLEVLENTMTTKPAEVPHHPVARAITFAACQRYYQFFRKYAFVGTAATANQIIDHRLVLGVPMRKTPNATIGPQEGNINASAPNFTSESPNSFRLQNSAPVVGRSVYLCDMTFDAEFGL